MRAILNGINILKAVYMVRILLTEVHAMRTVIFIKQPMMLRDKYKEKGILLVCSEMIEIILWR